MYEYLTLFLYIWIFSTVYMFIRMSVNKANRNTVFIQPTYAVYLFFFSIYGIPLMCYASLVLYKDHLSGVFSALHINSKTHTCTQRVFLGACVCFSVQYINSMCFPLSYFCISFSAEV